MEYEGYGMMQDELEGNQVGNYYQMPAYPQRPIWVYSGSSTAGYPESLRRYGELYDFIIELKLAD